MKGMICGLICCLPLLSWALDLRIEHNVVYKNVDGIPIALDLFRPEGQSVLPGVVLVHGGGWISGDKKAYDIFARELASLGYVVANINYRLAQGAAYPGPVEDVDEAVRWLRAHADKYAVDQSYIAGIGGSAGGHLISLVATNDHSDKYNSNSTYKKYANKLQASIVFGSGVDQVTRAKQTYNLDNKSLLTFFGGPYSERSEIYKDGSPLTHITAEMSPVLMVDGEHDMPEQRYPEYRKRLDQLGVRNEFKLVKEAKHGQWLNEPFRSEYIALCDRFLKSVFNKK